MAERRLTIVQADTTIPLIALRKGNVFSFTTDKQTILMLLHVGVTDNPDELIVETLDVENAGFFAYMVDFDEHVHPYWMYTANG